MAKRINIFTEDIYDEKPEEVDNSVVENHVNFINQSNEKPSLDGSNNVISIDVLEGQGKTAEYGSKDLAEDISHIEECKQLSFSEELEKLKNSHEDQRNKLYEVENQLKQQLSKIDGISELLEVTKEKIQKTKSEQRKTNIDFQNKNYKYTASIDRISKTIHTISEQIESSSKDQKEHIVQIEQRLNEQIQKFEHVFELNKSFEEKINYFIQEQDSKLNNKLVDPNSMIIEELHNSFKELEQNLNSTNDMSGSLNNRIDEVVAKVVLVDELNARIDELAHKINSSEGLTSNVDDEIYGKINQLFERTNDLFSSADNTKNDLGQTKDKIDELNNALNALAENQGLQIENVQKSLSGQIKKTDEIYDDLLHKGDAIQSTKNKISLLEDKLSEIASIVDSSGDQSSISELEARISNVENTQNNNNQDIETIKQNLELANENFKSNLDSLKEELMSSINSSEQQSNSVYEELKNQIASINDSLEELSQSNQSIEKLKDYSESKFNEITPAISSLQKTVDGLKKNNKETNNDYQPEIDSLSETMGVLEGLCQSIQHSVKSELENYGQNVSLIQERIEKLETRLNALNAKSSINENLISQDKEISSKTNSSVDQLVNEIAFLKNALEEENKSTSKIVNSLGKRINDQEDKFAELNKEILLLENQLKKEKNEHEKYVEKFKESFVQSNNEINKQLKLQSSKLNKATKLAKLTKAKFSDLFKNDEEDPSIKPINSVELMRSKLVRSSQRRELIQILLLVFFIGLVLFDSYQGSQNTQRISNLNQLLETESIKIEKIENKLQASLESKKIQEQQLKKKEIKTKKSQQIRKSLKKQNNDSKSKTRDKISKRSILPEIKVTEAPKEQNQKEREVTFQTVDFSNIQPYVYNKYPKQDNDNMTQIVHSVKAQEENPSRKTLFSQLNNSMFYKNRAD